MSKECRRPECTKTAHTGGKGYCNAHAYGLGVWTPFVDAAPTRRALQRKRDAGYSVRAIADATGVAYSTVHAILTGANTRIRQRTVDKIAQFDGLPAKEPTWPSARRLQSLLAAGWTLTELAGESGLALSAVHTVLHEHHPTVYQSTAATIRRVYAAHETDPVRPPHRLAVEHEWMPPMAWNDIDDPAESHLKQRRGPRPGKQAAA